MADGIYIDGFGMCLMGLLILSGFNSFRFEKEIEKLKAQTEDLSRTAKAIQSSSLKDDPSLNEVLKEVKVIEAYIAFRGNWLPSKYRQFIVSGMTSLVISVFWSSFAGVVAFCIYCLFFSTAGLRFWIETFARSNDGR